MRTLTTLLALSVAAPALAGSLTVEKKGPISLYAWVDGDEYGKIKGKAPLELDLPDGTHEVWLAIEKTGVVTACHGLVDVGPGGAVVIGKGTGKCEGLTPGYPTTGTAFKGASVQFTLSRDMSAWVSIDGGRALALPPIPFELNLTPGKHTIVLYQDAMASDVVAQGTVTVGQGQSLPVTCTSSGCVGWDQPPVTVVVLPVIGGVAPVAAPESAPAPSGEVDLSCCVNGQFFECPDADAVYKCSGAFMACQLNCDMMDMGCTDRCLTDHPIDPSDCSRTSSRDGECSD